METTVEQLIKERTFASLTEAELQSVKELCETEEEFMSMKQFFQELEGIAASQQTIIQPEIKESLDAIFSAKYPGIRANWTAPEAAPVAPAPIIPLYQRTWVRVAAIALIVLGTVPFWNLIKTDVPVKGKVLTAKLEAPKNEPVQPAIQQDKAKTTETQPAESVVKEEGVTRSVAAAESKGMSDEMTVSALAPGMDIAPLAYTWSSNTAVSANGLTQPFGIDQELDKDQQQGNGFVATGSTLNTKGTYFSSAVTTADSYSAFGRKADLYPGEVKGDMNAKNALSLAEQPDDLLDLLVPAF